MVAPLLPRSRDPTPLSGSQCSNEAQKGLLLRTFSRAQKRVKLNVRHVPRGRVGFMANENMVGRLDEQPSIPIFTFVKLLADAPL